MRVCIWLLFLYDNQQMMVADYILILTPFQ